MNSGTILIVEDNLLNLKFFTDLLGDRGHVVHSTKNGLEALALVRDLRPGLVIMDINLPGRSGLDVIQDIRADEAVGQVPILVVTAFAMPADAALIEQAGGNACLFKPIGLDEFVETAERLMGFPSGVLVH